MSKPRVAIFDFACCEGCQLQIVNLETEIIDLLSVITPVEWREAISDHSDEYDIAIIEGSITRPGDEERVKKIREKAAILIALGSCAVDGGINRIKNNFPLDDVKKYVYGKDAGMSHLATAATKSVGEVVKVDFNVPGCPIDKQEFITIIKALVQGKTPALPTYPVCVECKARENICRYEKNEICLGPITRAGCQAKCPSSGFWCYGCRGTVDQPNINAAKDIMEKYGKTIEELQSRMILFGSK
jgi:coenzyme F420-reducing hydrogenase gamma subunit